MLGLAVLGLSTLGSAVPALAQATETTTAGTGAEAWYRPPPTCASPLGCGPIAAPPSPFAPGTLRVGFSAGAEEARTYFTLDLAALPAGTVPLGGTVTLPVATGPRDGTRAPETAKVRLCLVTEEVKDGVEGDIGPPPAIDCMLAQSPAAFTPAAEAVPAALTADLTPFAAAWAAGTPNLGLAVVPAEGVPPTDSWQVAFSQKDRMAEGIVPITASVLFGSSAAATGGLFADPFALSPPPSDPAPPADLSFGSGSALPDPGVDSGFAAPPPTSTLPFPSTPSGAPGPAVAPQPATEAAAAQQPVAEFVLGGFAYPAVFLLPLVFAGVAAWAGRALTRDLAPRVDTA
ncbi:MAG: hypothetical protein AVDCRST_MAG57-680 [uncultured Blastococcus sp.]|uniref:Uncharacterized protein n=1 Tax=uncultured Blastococcus sp. TaxID=217144 RepID=A0A6J4HHW3_9ACTN|nr:MAG: hypothetical protein AVDCRST_MAG57-680 [uncultured Blastococcus sp.]